MLTVAADRIVCWPSAGRQRMNPSSLGPGQLPFLAVDAASTTTPGSRSGAGSGSGSAPPR